MKKQGSTHSGCESVHPVIVPKLTGIYRASSLLSTYGGREGNSDVSTGKQITAMENCSVSQRKSLSCRYAVHWCALNIREVYKSGISKDQCFCIFLIFLFAPVDVFLFMSFLKEQHVTSDLSKTKWQNVQWNTRLCWIQDAFWTLYGNQKAWVTITQCASKKGAIMNPT